MRFRDFKRIKENKSKVYDYVLSLDNKIVGRYSGENAYREAKSSLNSAHLPPMSLSKEQQAQLKINPIPKNSKKNIGDMILLIGEGYYKLPDMDVDRYQDRDDLEGPYMTRSGKVLYYDPVEGEYYDPDTDMYISYEDFLSYDRSRNESQLMFVPSKVGIASLKNRSGMDAYRKFLDKQPIKKIPNPKLKKAVSEQPAVNIEPTPDAGDRSDAPANDNKKPKKLTARQKMQQNRIRMQKANRAIAAIEQQSGKTMTSAEKGQLRNQINNRPAGTGVAAAIGKWLAKAGARHAVGTAVSGPAAPVTNIAMLAYDAYRFGADVGPSIIKYFQGKPKKVPPVKIPGPDKPKPKKKPGEVIPFPKKTPDEKDPVDPFKIDPKKPKEKPDNDNVPPKKEPEKTPDKKRERDPKDPGKIVDKPPLPVKPGDKPKDTPKEKPKDTPKKDPKKDDDKKRKEKEKEDEKKRKEKEKREKEKREKEKTQPKRKTQPQTKPGAKPGTKPGPNQKPDQKPELKPELKPNLRPQPQGRVQPQGRTQPQRVTPPPRLRTPTPLPVPVLPTIPSVATPGGDYVYTGGKAKPKGYKDLKF